MTSIDTKLVELKQDIKQLRTQTVRGMRLHVDTIMRLHQVCVKQQHYLNDVQSIIEGEISVAHTLALRKKLEHIKEDLLKVIPPMTTTGKNTGKKP